MKLYLNSIGLFASNMPSWKDGKKALKSNASWEEKSIKYPTPTILSSRERRRASNSVCIALAVAEEAIENSNYTSNELPIIFSSSVGEISTMHNILEALSTDDGFVSPTRFHNSVHNTASGYWSIGSGSAQSATSIAAENSGFEAGFLKAAMQAVAENTPVLFVVFDVPCPTALSKKIPYKYPIAIAFVLSPFEKDNKIAELNISIEEKNNFKKTDVKTNIGRKILQDNNPSAKGIILLEQISQQNDKSIFFDLDNQSLQVAINNV